MQRWRDLPLELLSSIMAYLEIKDNVHASLVSKSWYEAAVSVRVAEQPPLLFHLANSSDSYELYDPSNGNKHKLEFPDSLTCYDTVYSADGWLLMGSLDTSDLVLFNPFTRKSVVLPYFRLYFDFQLVAFSSAPTSNNCVVFIIDFDLGEDYVTISIWSPGQTIWTSVQFESQFSIDLRYNNVFFSNGLFYCLNLTNCLAVFDPSISKFDVLDVPLPSSPKHMYCKSWYNGKFVVENIGHIYVICRSENNEHMVFELNLEQDILEEKRSVGGLPIFVFMRSCE